MLRALSDAAVVLSSAASVAKRAVLIQAESSLSASSSTSSAPPSRHSASWPSRPQSRPQEPAERQVPHSVGPILNGSPVEKQFEGVSPDADEVSEVSTRREGSQLWGSRS